MTHDEEKLADLLTELYLLGQDINDADKPLIHARIAGELQSGQWALVTARNGEDEGALWGWISWYRVNDEVFEILKAEEQDSLVIAGEVVDIRGGDNLWLATAIVAPWAPSSTYRNLSALAKEANADCKRVGATLVKRDGSAKTYVRGLSA